MQGKRGEGMLERDRRVKLAIYSYSCAKRKEVRELTQQWSILVQDSFGRYQIRELTRAKDIFFITVRVHRWDTKVNKRKRLRNNGEAEQNESFIIIYHVFINLILFPASVSKLDSQHKSVASISTIILSCLCISCSLQDRNQSLPCQNHYLNWIQWWKKRRERRKWKDDQWWRRERTNVAPNPHACHRVFPCQMGW